MRRQPCGNAARSPISQQIDNATLLKINHDGPVRLPFPPGADSDEAARVFRACSVHRSNLMPPIDPI
jgi:hypothetical protein